MADTKVTPPAPKKRRGWLRALAWIFIILIVLVVAVYFVGTSSAFLKGVILPRVSKSLAADVTIGDASMHPFKEVVLHNLKVQPRGAEPLVTAPEVRARYSLMDIIRGNIHVDDLVLSSPTIVLTENPDGTSNLDPMKKAQKEKPAKKEQQAKPSKPTHIDVRKVSLTDGTVRKIKLYAGGNRDVTELSHLNLTVDDLKNGQAGKLQVTGDIQVQNNPPAPGTNGVLQAKLKGTFAFSLTPDLKPATAQGNARLDITRAEGAMAEMATLAANLDCQMTPTEIKQVALRFQKGSTQLGELHVSGPFDSAKTEGRLNIELRSIDKNVLNLAGAKSGMDFGGTTISSTNEIQLSKAGSVMTAVGEFDAAKFQLTRTNETTPPLDLRMAYNLTLNREEKTALLRGLTLNGNQNGAPLLRADLSSPMNLAWGKVSNAVGDSALNLSVNSLKLEDWKPFLGSLAQTGMVNAKLKLLSQQAGKLLIFDLNSQIENLTAGSGSNQITQAGVTLQASGKAVNSVEEVLMLIYKQR